MKRIKMIESGAEVPNDILTHILQVSCELLSANIKSGFMCNIKAVTFRSHLCHETSPTKMAKIRIRELFFRAKFLA